MSIFNTKKNVEDYKNTKLFLGEEPGLIDTINKEYPKIWALYKEMKSLDWDENEFNYSSCFNDFKNVDPDMSQMMLETIMWQWEADSVASQFPIVLIAPFNPCTELVEAEQAIMTNELVHANTYSEIVRMSFDDPQQVLTDMLAKEQTFERLHLVGSKLAEIQDFSIKYNYDNHFKTGVEYTDSEIIEMVIQYYFIMLLLERIQFMASFAITFTICKSGPFAPIGQAVKKIAQDELEVHAEFRKEVLTELRKQFSDEFEKVRPILVEMFTEVIDSEMTWTDILFKDRTLIGTSADLIKQWVLFNAKDVSRFIGFTKEDVDYAYPRSNPMPFLEDWFNMNVQQAAPQEQDIAAYKVNVVSRDDEDQEFDF